MSFLNPIFLYFLPLTAAPVIIHLLGRKRYHNVEFSSLRFLRELEPDVIRHLKLRQILLLILRSLIILLIVMAFARPYRTHRSSGIFIGKGETLYLLIDNSCSMSEYRQGATLLEHGLEGLIESGSAIEFPVTVKLVMSTQGQDKIESQQITGPNELKHLLTELSPTRLAGSLDRALRRIAGDIRQNREPSVGVWILSDFQDGDWQTRSWKPHPIEELLNLARVRLVCFAVDHAGENRAIRRIGIPDQIHAVGRRSTVETVLSNWNNHAADAVVSLYLNEQKVGQTMVALEPSASQEVAFEFIPSQAGGVTGKIEIDGDALSADNSRFFVLPIPEQLAVLIVADEKRGRTYLRKALTQKDMHSLEVTTTTASQLWNESLLNYDVLIFSGVSELSPGDVDRLRRFLGTGKGIIVWCDALEQQQGFNRLWADQLGLPRWRTFRAAQPDGFLRIGQLDREHPLFKDLWKAGQQLRHSPRFFAVPGFVLASDDRILAEYDDRTPLIIESLLLGGRGLLIASGLGLEWTDLPLSGFFPTVLHRAIYYLAGQSRRQEPFNTGDTLLVSLTSGGRADYYFQTPAGRNIRPRSYEDLHQIRLTETGEPGIYTLFKEGNAVRKFAVNIPERETASHFLIRADFQELIDRYPEQLFFVPHSGPKGVGELRRSHELFIPVVITLLVLAALETYVGRVNRMQSREAMS